MSGVTEIDEQQSNMLFSATWQSLISKFALQPGFQSMGLEIGDAERTAIISGEIPTQAMYSAFADPNTGVYNTNALNNFLLTSGGNPEAEAMWNMLTEQARIEREGNKYMALVMAGINSNSLEVADGVDGANKSFNGRWARKSYNSVSDSLVSVSASEIKSYYDANKMLYKRQPSRTISYVSFNVIPSASDVASLTNDAMSVGEEFAAATDLRTFIRENRNGSIAQNYIPASQLPSVEAEALVAGEMYGPVSDDSAWRMSRVFDSVDAADTLHVRHIVFSYTDEKLVDSLKVALRGGGDFAEAAVQYSINTQTSQNGGDIGAIPFSAFADEFADALASAKKGDIVQVSSGDMIQLIQVYDAGESMKHYKLASIEIPILPSDATRRSIHGSASEFAVSAKGNYDKFQAAATEAEVAPHSASVNQSTRSIAAIGGSQEISRWAHRAEIGDLSEIFKVNDGYVVAMLTEVDDSEYRSLKEVETTIKRVIANDKKFAMLSSELSGSSFDEISASMNGETGEFADVNLGSYYVQGLGLEPLVIGSIASSQSTGVASAPVKGNAGLYIFEVSDVTEPEEPQTFEAEKVRLESLQQRVAQQMLFGALESVSNIKDMRGANL